MYIIKEYGHNEERNYLVEHMDNDNEVYEGNIISEHEALIFTYNLQLKAGHCTESVLL